MAGMEEKIGQILSNPAAMQQIFTLAQSLGLSQNNPPSSPPPSASPPPSPEPAGFPPQNSQGTLPALPGNMPEMDAMFRAILELASKAGGDERQLALFEALKPFLKPQRVQQIDKAIQVARISRMASAALGRLGGSWNPGGGSHV